MAFFRRKKDNPDVLPELQQYYDAERRERAGLAWLLALVSVVCIALLVIGLFFGGRWIYRTVKNDHKKTTTSNNTGNQTDAPSVDGKSTDQGNPGSTSGGTSGGSTTAPAGGSGSTGSTGTTQTPTTTPNTGPDSNLPNTGPDGDY